jgi:hypothetical protein
MKLLRRHALFRIQRGDAIPDLEPRGDVTFRPVSRENLSDILSFRAKEYADVFDRQLAKGQLGVYAYRDGKAVAHGWMIINRSEQPMRANGYFVLRPREALVHFCSVAEPHRGLGVYQALLCDLYRRAFASEPVDTIFIDTVIDNVPSRKAIEKTARFVSNAYYLNLGSRGFRLPW